MLRGVLIIVITEKEIVTMESSEKSCDYAQFLDHSRFEPPAELSLPAYAFGRELE